MIKANITELRNKIIELALKQKHKPYVYGEKGPDAFDCAGFVYYLYKKLLNIDLYETGIGKSTTTKIMTCKYGTITYFEESSLNKNINLINKGDILFFHTQSKQDYQPLEINKYPGHCGIYLGDGKFIHCTTLHNHNQVIKTSFTKCKSLYKKLVAIKDIISTYKD